MRRGAIIGLLLGLLSLFFIGCLAHHDLQVLNFGATETNMTFRLRVTRGASWEIKCCKCWVSYSPDNGESGFYEINVAVDRTGLCSGNYEARLNVFSEGEVVVSATVLMVVKDSTEGENWQIETVDNLGGYQSIHAISLMLDSNDRAHISYLVESISKNYELRYATDISGNWEVETIEISEGLGSLNPKTSIALDSNDKVHICYGIAGDYYELGLPGNELKYASNASGNWLIKTVDSVAGLIDGPSLSLDSEDKVHISYSAPSYITHVSGDHEYGFYYATNASNFWEIEQLVFWWGGSGRATSIALDSNDKVHIICTHLLNGDSDTVTHLTKYASNSSGSWGIEELDMFLSEFSLAVDSDDRVHVSNLGGCPPQGFCYRSVQYTTNSSGNWIAETFDGGTSSRLDVGSSLALDSSDNAYIGYSVGGHVHAATNASGNWVAVPLEQGSLPVITLDSSDKVHISYYGYPQDGNTTLLRYARHKQ